MLRKNLISVIVLAATIVINLGITILLLNRLSRLSESQVNEQPFHVTVAALGDQINQLEMQVRASTLARSGPELDAVAALAEAASERIVQSLGLLRSDATGIVDRQLVWKDPAAKNPGATTLIPASALIERVEGMRAGISTLVNRSIELARDRLKMEPELAEARTTLSKLARSTLPLQPVDPKGYEALTRGVMAALAAADQVTLMNVAGPQFNRGLAQLRQGTLTDQQKESLAALEKHFAKTYALARAYLSTSSMDARILIEQLAGLDESALRRLEVLRTEATQAHSEGILTGSRQTKRIVILTTTIGLLLGTAVAVYIAVSTIRRLTQIVDELTGSAASVGRASSHVASSSKNLADGASTQAASLQETCASLEEITSMARQNSENAQSAKAIAGETRQAAEEGSSEIAQMNAAMEGIRVSSTKISKIIKTIDEIAFQTNILALNAAVEAARAGEAGAGFAVVAEEVRALAQRSAQAAQETVASVDDAVSRSAIGVEQCQRVNQRLAAIADKARRVDEVVGEIATASHEQTQGIGQVNTAVSAMDQVVQGAAAQAEQGAGVAQELTSLSQGLNDCVTRLSRVVSSANGRRAERSPPRRPGGSPA